MDTKLREVFLKGKQSFEKSSQNIFLKACLTHHVRISLAAHKTNIWKIECERSQNDNSREINGEIKKHVKNCVWNKHTNESKIKKKKKKLQMDEGADTKRKIENKNRIQFNVNFSNFFILIKFLILHGIQFNLNAIVTANELITE